MKGLSSILVAIFLVIISVSLTYGFLIWSQAAQETVQESIEEEAERRGQEFVAGLAIVAVADNQVSVQNTGRNIIETDGINVLLDGRRAAIVADRETIGPGQVAVINVSGFVPGMRKIRVTGPFNTGDETEEPLLYPGTVAFWDFLSQDEGHPQDLSAGGNDGRLNGTTVLALHFDESRGDITKDASGYANDGTMRNGVGWTRGVTRNALSFDGNDDHVFVPNSPSLEIGTAGEDFTVEFWFYLRQGSTGSWRNIIHKGSSDCGTNDRTPAMWMRPENNKIHYRISTTASCNEGGDSNAEISLNRWTYIAYVKRGNTLSLYIDGRLDSSTNLAGTVVSSSGPLYIGDDPWYAGTNGIIDEFALHRRVLTTAEVADSFQAKRVLFSDYVAGPLNSALFLNGNDSHVNVPDSISLDLFSQATLEAWIDMKNGRSAEDTILRKEGAYHLWVNSGSNKPGARIWTQGGPTVIVNASSAITRNDWHHVVATADGAELKIYVDGTLSDSTPYDGQIPFTDTPLLLGTRTTAYSGGVLDGAFNGTIDYVALYKVALSADEIREIYEAATQ